MNLLGLRTEPRWIASGTLSLFSILAAVLASTPVATASGANCARTSVGFKPLIDLGTGTYKGYRGGLYPGGSNQPPASYLQSGIAHSQMIRPLNLYGQPDANGRMVLLSIGMSNTAKEFSGFKLVADADPEKNPRLVIVNGAQGGWDAERIKNPSTSYTYWNTIEQRLNEAGVSRNQVQAVWLKEAIAGENRPFPKDARQLQSDLQSIIQILIQRYPYLQIVYLASRTYAGYATTNLNPEPYAYESGFAVKWLIQSRIQSQTSGPWVGWGPYLWTDGTVGRSDGFVWNCSDVSQTDGTHPSTSGVQKIADMLLNFFKTDVTAKSWFLRTS